MKLMLRLRTRAVSLAIAGALALGGCAFVPKAYPRLDEADKLGEQAHADAAVQRFAAVELAQAQDALGRARAARATLDDPAVVDHLTYLAKQRFAIAHEAAGMRAAHATLRY